MVSDLKAFLTKHPWCTVAEAAGLMGTDLHDAGQMCDEMVLTGELVKGPTGDTYALPEGA